MMLSQQSASDLGKKQNKNPWALDCELFPCSLSIPNSSTYTFLTTLWFSGSPVHIKKISYTIFKLAFFAILWDTRNVRDMELCYIPTQVHGINSLQLQARQVPSLPTSLGHILHKPKKFQTKVLSFIYLHSSKWYSQHLLNFGQESIKSI